jgi:outer membrane protein assembly factor BamD (BamD/ComL family)
VKKKPETQAVPKHKVARELRGRAQDALARGDFERASELMEELLGQIPASDPVAGTVRLDLSRIYLKNLKKPQRAAHHLRQFVKSRPADAATPLAKEELCRIVSESGSADPLCVP